MIIYLDLDRTLFRTEAFFAVWAYIAELYPEAAGAAENRSAYYRTVDDMYFYDMSAQLADLGLDPATVYAEVAASEFGDGRLEYPGVGQLIETLESRGAEVRLLTFGSDDCQRFKASLCPSLRQLPVITTVRAKPDVLHDSEEECWLVDDKPIGAELPGNVSFVQVALDGQVVPPDTEWPVFTDLLLAKEFFEDVLE